MDSTAPEPGRLRHRLELKNQELKETRMGRLRKEGSGEKPSWNFSHQQGKKKIISKKSNMKQLS